jgi:hypothetical protein
MKNHAGAKLGRRGYLTKRGTIGDPLEETRDGIKSRRRCYSIERA